MNKLNIDLDLLLELSLMESRGEGDCYISLKDGEFSYIPKHIIEALKEKGKFDALESWERELTKEAENIVMNYSDNYIYIPIIDDKILINSMKSFLNTLSPEDKMKIEKMIDFSNPFLSFNKTLINNNKLDEYLDFRSIYLKDYLIKWLEDNNIEAI